MDVSLDTADGLELTGAGVRRRGPWRQALGRLRRRPLGIAALAVVVAFFVVGALADVLAPYPAGQTFLEFITRPQPPLTPGHLLGTDYLGRDFLTQLLFAIRQSAELALVAMLGAAAIGVVVGTLAGYYGGVIDAALSWLTGIVVTVPAIAVVLLVVVYSWPVSPVGFGLALMLYLWTTVARAVRASVASLRVLEFVEAAHAAGASDARVLVRHLLPNSLGTVIVATTGLVGQSIGIVATVTFFGYGTVQSEKPTLGSMIASAVPGPGVPWWLGYLPIAILVLLVVCVNFAGDTLDDALNPRQSRP
jgi:ABC-type dipeptide/oligopeptide/nickel transport system permease subunit